MSLPISAWWLLVLLARECSHAGGFLCDVPTCEMRKERMEKRPTQNTKSFSLSHQIEELEIEEQTK